MSDDQLSRALWGALAVLVVLMLEASDRLRDDQPADVVHVTPDVAVIEEPPTEAVDEDRRA